MRALKSRASGAEPWPGESGAPPGLKPPLVASRPRPGSPDPPPPNSPEGSPHSHWPSEPPLPQSPQWA